MFVVSDPSQPLIRTHVCGKCLEPPPELLAREEAQLQALRKEVEQCVREQAERAARVAQFSRHSCGVVTRHVEDEPDAPMI